MKSTCNERQVGNSSPFPGTALADSVLTVQVLCDILAVVAQAKEQRSHDQTLPKSLRPTECYVAQSLNVYTSALLASNHHRLPVGRMRFKAPGIKEFSSSKERETAKNKKPKPQTQPPEKAQNI